MVSEVFFCAHFQEAVSRKTLYMRKDYRMKIINGVCTSAKIFTDTVEDYALAQIQMLCDNRAMEGCNVRIMPDVHPGKVGTVGFTSTVGERILPNVVGIDIGCGITLARLKQKKGRIKPWNAWWWKPFY